MQSRAYNVLPRERARTTAAEAPSAGFGRSGGGNVNDGALVVGEDGRARCFWAGSAPEYIAYHDEEWGRPVRDDQGLYERMTLEAFQSGLAWITILRKREGFRKAFAGFDIERVADFDEADVERLLADAGIVRHRGKIEAAIANARATVALRETEAPLPALVWSYRASTDGRAPRSAADWQSTTPESIALAKELRLAGFRFVGPTTVYAAMQACGVVNDHLATCPSRGAAEAARAAARLPT